MSISHYNTNSIKLMGKGTINKQKRYTLIIQFLFCAFLFRLSPCKVFWVLYVFFLKCDSQSIHFNAQYFTSNNCAQFKKNEEEIFPFFLEKKGDTKYWRYGRNANTSNYIQFLLKKWNKLILAPVYLIRFFFRSCAIRQKPGPQSCACLVPAI